jgi:hypothetical protein
VAAVSDVTASTVSGSGLWQMRDLARIQFRQRDLDAEDGSSRTLVPFLAVQIGHEVDEESVAEIFLRVNSGGTPLTQADFILTLLSVFRAA